MVDYDSAFVGSGSISPGSHAHQLDPLAPLPAIAIAAADGKKTAASVDSRGVGELFQAVVALPERLAVRAVGESTAVHVDVSSVSVPLGCRPALCKTSVGGSSNLLVILIVLGQNAGGQGGDEDGEVLHFGT